METLEHIQEQAFTIHEDGTLHVPPARNRRLFAPGQNAWLKACRHWVQQGHKEDPCDVFPALERLINLLDEPFDAEVAQIHLQCVQMVIATRAIVQDKANLHEQVDRLIAIAWQLLGSGSLPVQLATDLEEQAHNLVAQASEPLSVCREILQSVAAKARPIDRNRATWHLRQTGWLCDLIQYLLAESPALGERSVRVPFVLVVKSKNDEGITRLAEFEVHVLPKGHGQVFITLEQAFVRFEKGFDAIFNEVPAAVQALLDNTEILPDIRITINFLEISAGTDDLSYSEVPRILASPKGKTLALEGTSATATVGIGLYCALAGKAPDTRVIALARVDKSGSLGEVESIPDKVKTVVNSGLFDMIVVADDNSERMARNALRVPENQLHVQIQRASTLEEFAHVRSALIQEVLGYLRDLAEKSAELPTYFPLHVRGGDSSGTQFDEVRQTVRVIEDRTIFDKWLSQERERLLRAGVDRAALAYGPSRGLPEDEIGGEAGGDSGETLLWDERGSKRFTRATILGDPGFGKTWLLRHEARRLARDGIRDLKSRSRSINDLVIPVYLRLADLANCDNTLEWSIVELIGQDHSEEFCKYLQRRLGCHNFVILLDAWDEVSDLDKRRRLRDRIHAFADKHSSKMLLTSRIVGYDLTPPPIPNSKELQLLAFNWPQVEAFVQVWFGRDMRDTCRFLSTLRGHPQFRGLSRIPLMLTMLCQACPEGDFPSRRSDLYRRCLRGLFRDWHIQDKNHLSKYSAQKLSDAYIGALVGALEHASLEFVVRRWQQFREEDLRRILESWLTDLHDTKPWHEFVKESTSPTELIERFKDAGLLIPATGSDGGELSFLHLTFQEYLAAKALASKRDSIEEALKHVYDPAWNQVLVMLGGTLEAGPAAYIAALLRKNREDLLCRPLQLAMQAAVETGRDRLPEEVLRGFTQVVAQMCLASTNLGYLLPITSPTIRQLPGIVPNLLNALKSQEWSVRSRAVQALRVISSEEALESLVTLLRDDQHDWVRRDAARAIASIGSEQAVNALLQAFKSEYNSLRQSCVGALAEIRSEQVIEALIDALHNAGTQCSTDAAMHLGDMRCEQALDGLLEVLKNPWEIARGIAARAISKIGSQKVIEPLLQALKSQNKNSRDGAAMALGEIRSEEAIEPLLKMLSEDDWFVHRNVAEAIGKIGSEKAVKSLLELLKNKDGNVRAGAAIALGGIGSEQAVRPLSEALSDRDLSVRRDAAEALSKIGSEQAVGPLLKASGDKDGLCRVYAAMALGRINPELAIKPLSKALKEKNFLGSQYAVKAIGRINSDQAIKLLIKALRHREWIVRHEAAEALGRIGSKRAIKPLQKALKDKEDTVRSSVAEALGKINSEQALGSLIEALGDNDQYLVRPTAARALRRMGFEQKKGLLLGQMKDCVISDKGILDVLKRLVTRRKSHSMRAVPMNIKNELDSLAASLEDLAKSCECVDGP